MKSHMGEQPGLWDALSQDPTNAAGQAMRRKLHDMRADVLGIGRMGHDIDGARVARMKAMLAEMEAERGLTAPPEPQYMHVTGSGRSKLIGDHLLMRLVQIESHEWQRCQPKPAEPAA
jgi:hypothetical protein